jgi:hypothetical protein
VEKIVKQYRAHLELTTPKPTICEFVGEDLETLKSRTQVLLTHVLSGNADFRPAQTASLTLVFHPNFNEGKTPLGWIAPYDVPESMSVGAAIEQRLEAAA